MDKKLLPILACPVTKGPLRWEPEKNEWVSVAARLAFPMEDGIPVLLVDKARGLSTEEYLAWQAKR